MSHETTVYDLGEVALPSNRPAPAPMATPAGTPARPTPRPSPTSTAAGRGGFELAGTLAMIVPGSGHAVRGELATGVFLLVSMGFLASFGWALVETLDRLSATLVVLGYSRAHPVWALGAVYVLAAAVHIGSVLTLGPSPRGEAPAPHPAVSGLASLLIPGWGQILNGDRRRAALFLAGLWLIGASWLLVSAPCRELLSSMRLHLPAGLVLLGSAPVRWTLPAVILALAVYDAAACAAARR